MRRLSGAPILHALRDERGVILPIVLLFLLIMVPLTSALLMASGSEVTAATNLLRGVQAQYLAEAGLQDAFGAFRATPSLITSAPASMTAVPGLSGPGDTLAAFGTYTAFYQRLGTNAVRVVATGTSNGGVGRQVVSGVISNSFSTTNAVLVEDNLVVSGNPTINGSCSSIHANGDLTLTGNPTVEGSATAVGTYTASGNPNVGPGSGGNKPTQTVPAIVPSDFLAAAKTTLTASEIFQMKANGQVLDGNDAVLTTLTSGQTYRNFTYSSGSPANFSLSGNSSMPGFYYFEGNATVSGNPGSVETPWQTTLVATRNITVSGNPQIEALLPDTLLISGNNITISGNPALGFNGLVGAANVITISGNAHFNGLIIAGNATSLTDSISGNPTITGNCSLSTPLVGKLRIVTFGR